MNESLTYIIDKWDLDIDQEMPIQIPNSNRVVLAKLYAELGYRKGAEIGVASGGHSAVISKHNPKCEVFCIDSWVLYDGLRDFKDSYRMCEFEIMAHNRLNPLKNATIIKGLSMDVVKQFDDESLDFVYIDANHEWPYVTQDIFYWEKKVRPGGILAGHDYDRKRRRDGLCQVKEVVHAYTEAFDVSPWFVMGRPDRSQNWLWVKE